VGTPDREVKMKMNCPECGEKMRLIPASVKRPYHYSECGLSNVYLVGIDVRECVECGVEQPLIPKMKILHEVIASTLIDKPSSLIGEEIRYLRTWMGLPSAKLAHWIGFTPEYVSNVEHERKNLGAAADRLIRVLATCKVKRIDFDHIARALDELCEERDATPSDRTFQLRKQEWIPQAA
jgi:DNA-binding transcriptional regulator YiaG